MRRLVMAACAALLVIVSVPVFAQETNNLLTNGGMEEGEFGPYLGKGRGDLNIPAGWDLWLGQGETDQYYNRGDKVYGYPHNGPAPNPLEGAAAVNLHGGFIQYNLAMFQTVPVSAETNLLAEVASYLIACDTADGEPGACASDPSSGAQTRIGIDPDGGSDPNAPEIVWSNWVTPHDQWGRQSVQATASGTQVTVFLYATQARPLMNNYVFWDDAKLTIGGEGGTAPIAPAATESPASESSGTSQNQRTISTPTPIPPRPPAYAPFVIPQTANEDGSLVHIVQEGDTFSSIAYAYGLKPDELLERNPTLRSTRFIMVGQEIIIVPAPEATSTPAG